MPVAKNPLLPEFYVYTLGVGGTPFYVGIGRSSRASDRVRYVKYLMSRQEGGKSVKWVRSNEVVANNLRKGLSVDVEYLHKELTRPQALVLEKQEIARLLKLGHALANLQHNRISQSA